MKKGLLRRLSSLLLTLAVSVTFMPALTQAAYAYSGSWELTEGYFRYNCKKGETTVDLDASEFVKINKSDADDSIKLSDLSYEWFDEDNNAIEGEDDDSVMTVNAADANYTCKVTACNDEEDSQTIVFRVYAYRPAVTSLDFTPNGVHKIREYTYGYFTSDKITDGKGNHVDDTDCYYYYDGESDGYYYYGREFFNDGDKIKAGYEDGTSKVFTYKYTDLGKGSFNGSFYDDEGNELGITAWYQMKSQSFSKQYKLGDKVGAKLRYWNDEDNIVYAKIKDFAVLVKNPDAVLQNGILFYKNDDKNAKIRGFYDGKATSVTIPETVVFGDGKKCTVTEIDNYAFCVKNLKSIIVPASVKIIGEKAFGYYYGIKDKNSEKEDYIKTDGFLVDAKTGSAAYAYAKDNGLTVAKTNGKAQSDAKTKEKIKKARAKVVKGVKVKALKKGKAQVSWKKTAGVKGYQVFRSTKKKSGFKRVATIKKVKTVKWNDKKLKKGKKYYYKVRTYTVVNGKNVYGKWSAVKAIKAK